MGSRKPARSARTPELPAVTTPTFLAATYPLVVSTPTTRPFSRRMPMTSQFWMMSTPRASAPLANPPCDGVVPGGPAAPLQGRPHHRVARVRGRVDDRNELFHLLGGEDLAVDAVEPVSR